MKCQVPNQVLTVDEMGKVPDAVVLPKSAGVPEGTSSIFGSATAQEVGAVRRQLALGLRLLYVLVLAASASYGAEAKLGLTDFVILAVGHDPNLRAASLGASLAPGQMEVAKSAYHPKVVPFYNVSKPGPSSANKSYGLNVNWDTGWGIDLKGFALDSQMRVQEDYLDYGTRDYGLEFGVPLGRDFGRLPAKIRLSAADAEGRRSKRELENDQQRAILDAVRAYYSNLQAAKALAVGRTAFERAQRSLELTEVKYELGEVSRLDLDRARRQAQQAETSVLQSETQLARVRQGISSTYHINASHQVRFVLPDLSRLRLPWPADQAIAMALDKDPSLLNARDQLQLTELRLKAARRNLFPALDFTYRVGKRRENDGGVTGDYENYQEMYLSSDLSLGIAEKKLAIRTAEVNHEVQEIGLRQLEDAVRGEVINHLDAFSRMSRLVDLSGQSLQSARSQAEVAELRFERGLGSAFDVVESQVQLQNSEQQFLADQIELVMSYYSILYRLQMLDSDRLLE